MTTYVDASVVLRIVLGESNPLDRWDHIDPVSSELIRVECLRTLERGATDDPRQSATLAGRRGDTLRYLEAIDLVAMSPPVLERAADQFPIYVATLDAIHLATAVLLRDELIDLDFATHDARLALAARSMGFPVIGA